MLAIPLPVELDESSETPTSKVYTSLITIVSTVRTVVAVASM